MNCNICGLKLKLKEEMETYVGYFSPSGHDHDDNCHTRLYICDNGHQYNISKRNKCSTPGCDWKGKEDCFCHVENKVDEWSE